MNKVPNSPGEVSLTTEHDPISPQSFSLKEMIRDLMVSVSRIEGKLDSKANEADLRGLESRVAILERPNVQELMMRNQRNEERINNLETRAVSQDALERYRKWLGGTVVTLLVTVIFDLFMVLHLSGKL